MLIGAGAAGATAVLGWAGVTALTSRERPLALVYRGPASCSGCSESVAALLESTPTGFRTRYVGPDEDVDVTPKTLAGAVVYAQPGGGDVDPAWRRLHRYADDIRDFVHNGGHYLGFCLGGYLAGATPGFALLPGDTDRYIGSPNASVHTTDDTLVRVNWRGRQRTMFFQDGPIFRLRPGAAATVLASYDTGAPAAVITAYGSGRVGVVGPHPEADRSWYRDADLSNPDGVHPDLGYDLVETTLHGPAPTSPGGATR
ncbi:hypothetical protein GTS_50590 [Gandjariella thermophila]|uniref:Biotin-protein ligase N-terminal domain-containing protein n=1 Tax=Gandjariella thermophila TaxID=1931992 RepID=A0A4D4JG93_9PSEU|nr:hypothetical protein GTS_50590 [Gandjariella thermophila]